MTYVFLVNYFIVKNKELTRSVKIRFCRRSQFSELWLLEILALERPRNNAHAFLHARMPMQVPHKQLDKILPKFNACEILIVFLHFFALKP